MSIQSTLRLSCILGALLALPLTLSACDTVNDEPAADQAQAIPVMPQAPIEAAPQIQDPQSEIWRPGYWRLKAGQFIWVPGQVIPRPSPTAVWASAVWVRHAYGWSFQEGHWE